MAPSSLHEPSPISLILADFPALLFVFWLCCSRSNLRRSACSACAGSQGAVLSVSQHKGLSVDVRIGCILSKSLGDASRARFAVLEPGFSQPHPLSPPRLPHCLRFGLSGGQCDKPSATWAWLPALGHAEKVTPPHSSRQSKSNTAYPLGVAGLTWHKIS